MARAGSVIAPGPFTFLRLGFNSQNVFLPGRWSGCDSRQPHQFFQAARQHAAESPKLSSLRAARRQPAIFIWGRGRQAMHLPCKQVDVGALPTDSTNFNCGENEIQVSFISSTSVGATPTPATNIHTGSDPAARL